MAKGTPARPRRDILVKSVIKSKSWRRGAAILSAAQAFTEDVEMVDEQDEVFLVASDDGKMQIASISKKNFLGV